MRITIGAIALVLALSTSAPRAGAEDLFSTPVAADSKKAMEASIGALSEKPVVAGTFIQSKRIRRLGRDLVSKGQFVFSAKDGIWWNVLSPYPTTILMTEDRLVERSPDGKSSVLDASKNPAFKRFATILRAVFSGDLTILGREFDLYYDAAGSSWRLGLVPHDPSMREIVASMEIDGDATVRSMKLREAGGDVITYEFTTTRSGDAPDADERKLFLR
jgi:hypothetical protein